MKKELDYYIIDGSVGWNQDWFTDWWMHVGGCGAVTACDLSIYLARNKGLSALYPYDPMDISKADFLSFAEIMKTFLRPRHNGIDRLDIYVDGYNDYLKDRGVESILVDGIEGERPAEEAWDIVKDTIADGIIIPVLLLRHEDRAFDDYEWHWFNIAGYDDNEGRHLVKVVTYGEYHWLDFDAMWNTGFDKKGGLIRVSLI